MINTTQNLLKETALLLKQLNNQEYSAELEVLHGNSIGKHIRHILDLFECLVESVDNSQLNYDKRNRNPEIETSVEKATVGIEYINRILPELDLNQKLNLSQIYEQSEIQLETSVGRELMYNIEHAVHHLAIIRIGIEQNFQSIKVSEKMGIAYSTLQYREN